MPQKKKKNNADKKVTVVVKPQNPQPGPSMAKPKRKGPGSTNNQGTVTLRRSELVSALTLPAGKSTLTSIFGFDLSSLPYLTRFQDLFLRWVVHSVKYTYKTACPSTQGGRVQMGFDWSGSATTSLDRAKIAQYAPSVGGVIWRDFQMTLPAKELMSRKFYLTTASNADKIDTRPGVLVVSVDALLKDKTTADFVVGEIWVEYSVKLMEPRPA